MNIRRLPDPTSARAWCREQLEAGRSIGFVPTMGALHEGHLSLLRRARDENDVSVVSVFVNPLQFDQPEDLAQYPRDFDGDARLLDGEGCHMVFTGTLAGFFPEASGPDAIPAADPGPGAEGLEGEHRSGHFQGVATIVRRLFEIVTPTRAYFGAKDFQQTLVVRHVAENLADGPRIVVCPTSREADGVARATPNQRLAAQARERAPVLSAALFRARAAWRDGERDPVALERVLRESLQDAELELEYAAVRDPRRWTAEVPSGPLATARALVAARLGGVRLIDNLSLDAADDEGPEPAGG